MHGPGVLITGDRRDRLVLGRTHTRTPVHPYTPYTRPLATGNSAPPTGPDGFLTAIREQGSKRRRHVMGRQSGAVQARTANHKCHGPPGHESTLRLRLRLIAAAAARTRRKSKSKSKWKHLSEI
ncbi:hypothetical protein GGP41_004945 [Bipolaris sorokiniana]|uniref:Uncharacterized protein n=1 Tax=Cochliobolus sativus TaxID=45130 RepID=A0A8H5Z7G8_COCSA|nr:hypothetical protein GGP41_004945 [Bipolaris sorokiniana]